MDRNRALLEKLYRAALAGVDPRRAVVRALREPVLARRIGTAGRVGVFAVGKAAAAMAGAVPERLFGEALIVIPRSAAEAPPAARFPPPAGNVRVVLEASHPEPDASSVAAARRAVRFFEGFGRGDLILCLVSGGTSSLLCLPKPGLTLSAKRRRIREAVLDGSPDRGAQPPANLAFRRQGRPPGRRTQASLVTLVLSDVPGDRPKTVGSGPTIRGRAGGDLVRVVGSNRSGLLAARERALGLGREVVVRSRRLSGEAAEEGVRLGREAARLSPGGPCCSPGRDDRAAAAAAWEGRAGARARPRRRGAPRGIGGHPAFGGLGRPGRELPGSGSLVGRFDPRAGAARRCLGGGRARAARYRALLRGARRSLRDRPDGHERCGLDFRRPVRESPGGSGS